MGDLLCDRICIEKPQKQGEPDNVLFRDTEIDIKTMFFKSERMIKRYLRRVVLSGERGRKTEWRGAHRWLWPVGCVCSKRVCGFMHVLFCFFFPLCEMCVTGIL